MYLSWIYVSVDIANERYDNMKRFYHSWKDEEQKSVNLLNYRKDGSTFINEFFISPLYSYENGRKVLSYFIGIQCPVSHTGPGQAPKNPGWVYTHGSRNDDEQKMNDNSEIHYKAGMKIVSSFNDLKNSVDTQ